MITDLRIFVESIRKILLLITRSIHWANKIINSLFLGIISGEGQKNTIIAPSMHIYRYIKYNIQNPINFHQQTVHV